jgi:hypothetical protein
MEIKHDAWSTFVKKYRTATRDEAFALATDALHSLTTGPSTWHAKRRTLASAIQEPSQLAALFGYSLDAVTGGTTQLFDPLLAFLGGVKQDDHYKQGLGDAFCAFLRSPPPPGPAGAQWTTDLTQWAVLLSARLVYTVTTIPDARYAQQTLEPGFRTQPLSNQGAVPQDEPGWQRQLTRLDAVASLPTNSPGQTIGLDNLFGGTPPGSWSNKVTTLAGFFTVGKIPRVARTVIAHHLLYTVASDVQSDPGGVRRDLTVVLPLLVPGGQTVLSENAAWVLRLLDVAESKAGYTTLTRVWDDFIEPTLRPPFPLATRKCFAPRFAALLDRIVGLPLAELDVAPADEIEFLVTRVMGADPQLEYANAVDGQWLAHCLRALATHLTQRADRAAIPSFFTSRRVEWKRMLDEATTQRLFTAFSREGWEWRPAIQPEEFLRPVLPIDARRRAFREACSADPATMPATWEEFRVRPSLLTWAHAPRRTGRRPHNGPIPTYGLASSSAT